MKCYRHYERNAVSTCMDCGKGLCPECSAKFNYQLCSSCFLSRIEKNKRVLIRNAVIMAALFIFGMNEYGEVLIALALAGIPWGWSALNAITPDIFLFLPLGGWILYFIVKLMASALIGIFVLPFQVYKIIKGLKEAEQLRKYAS